MKLIYTTILAIFLLSTAASCSKDAMADQDTDYSIDLTLAQQNDAQFAQEVLVLINQLRATLNIDPIINGTAFSSAYAVKHTNYMIDLHEINHHNFGIRSAALENDGANVVGENVAFGFNTPESVVNAWLNSPSHRNNIEGNYTHSGFGIKKCPQTNTYYFTQLFYKI